MTIPFGSASHNHPLDRVMIADYFNLRDPGHREEYVYILCVPDVDTTKTKKVSALPRTIVAPTEIIGPEWDEIERLNRQGYAIFIAFNIRSNDMSAKRTAKHMRTAFGLVIDVDDEENMPQDFPIEPTFTVRSSKNRFHAYFMFDAPMRYGAFRIGRWTNMMKSLADEHGGDRKICIETVLIRIPGTYNCKIKPGKRRPTKVRLISKKEPYYSINALRKYFSWDTRPEEEHKESDFSSTDFSGIEENEDKLRSALDWLNREEMPDDDPNLTWAQGLNKHTDDRDPWLRVTMATKRTGLENAEDIAREWSSARDKYVSDEDFNKTWRSLDRKPLHTSVTIASIYKLCENTGWIYQAQEEEPEEEIEEPKEKKKKSVAEEYMVLLERKPEGAIKDLMYYIYHHHDMMPPQWAICTGLAICSGLVANRYYCHEGYTTGASLMLNAMGFSMSGKDSILRIIQKVMVVLGNDKILTPPGATLEGVEDYLFNNGSTGLMLIDEAGDTMAKTNEHTHRVSAAFRRLYSADPTGIYFGRATSSNEGKLRIKYPFLTVMSLGNYTNFHKMVDVETIEEGTLGRNLYFIHPVGEMKTTENHVDEEITQETLPTRFTEVCECLLGKFKSGEDTDEELDKIVKGPKQISSALKTTARQRLEERMKWVNPHSEEVERQLYGRIHENAMRITLIEAVFDDISWAIDDEPGQLKEEDYQWSMDLLHLNRKHTRRFVEKNVGKKKATEGDMMKLTVQELRSIRKIVKNKKQLWKSEQRFVKILERGFIPISMLSQRCAQIGIKKYDHVPAKDIQTAVRDLADRSQIVVLERLTLQTHGINYHKPVIKLSPVRVRAS